MSPDRQALVDSLVRHARFYWLAQKRVEESRGTPRHPDAAFYGEKAIAEERLLAASLALGEHDATIHPVDAEPKGA